MILHYVECSDGTRHVHRANCRGLAAQLKAGEVWEIDIANVDDDDEILLAVWGDFFGDANPDDDELDTFAEMTVFRECLGESESPEKHSGNRKADDFIDEARAAGWAVDFAIDPDDEEYLRGYVVVKARREYVDLSTGIRTEQVLDLSWSPSRLIDAHHLSGLAGDVAKRLSSVAGAIKILHADHPRSVLNGKKVSSRHVDREQPVKRVLKQMIPFDLEEAYDDEILDACRGKKLIWWNDTSEDYESATVIGKNPKHYRIETGTAGRAIISFVSVEGGFRAVALEHLVQVR